LRLIDRAGDCLHLARHVIVDVHETEALARRVLDPNYLDDERDAVELTDSGELLPAWYEDWVLIEREKQRQLLLHALESLCERFTRRRSFGPAIAAGIAAVQGEPLRESAHRALIQAYVAEGNLGEAIRQYSKCKRVLQEQLGLEPSADLTESVRKLFQRETPVEGWAEPPRHGSVTQPDVSPSPLQPRSATRSVTLR
jgi:DNA-binding SARP family transcriptional activator